MPDSEGTWQIGQITGADFALEDAGQYSPSGATDTWALAAVSMQPVAMRAAFRGLTQLVELAAGERAFSLGVSISAGRLLTAGAVAAELMLDDVRVRRPVQIRCSYDGGVTTTALYPRLAAGTGSDASEGVESLAIADGAAAMRLVNIYAYCFGTPGLTDFTLMVGGVAGGTATLDLVTGTNVVNYLTQVGAHTIDAGTPLSLEIDPTNAHGIVVLLLELEEVPA